MRAPSDHAEVKVVSKDPASAREHTTPKATPTRVAALAPGLSDGSLGAVAARVLGVRQRLAAKPDRHS